MKKGLTIGIIAWIISLVVMPFIAPILFHGANMEAIGRIWFGLSFLVIGVPAFLFGFMRSRRDS